MGGYQHHHYHGACGTSALSVAGATTTLLGTATIVAGVIVFVSGANDVDRAQRMKRYFWGPITLQPTLNGSGGGVQLRLEH